MRLFASLQSTFVALFALVAAVPLLIFGYLADIYLSDLHLSQVERELSLYTEDIRGEVDTLLAELRRDLDFIGDECDRLLLEDPGKIDSFLQNAVDGRPYYLSIYFVDEDKRIRYLGLPGPLAENKEDYRGLDLSRHILLLAAKGRPTITTTSMQWSEVFVSVTSGEPAISLIIPLKQGALLGTIDLRGFTRTLDERIFLDAPIEFAIVDRHGTLLAQSNPEAVMQRTNLLKIHPEILEALSSQKDVAFKLHEDESLLESVRIVRDPVWVIHASLSREIALRPLQQVRGLLLLTISGAVLGSLVLAVWLAHRISRPLLRLRDTAAALASGDYGLTESLQAERFDEIETLGGSFRRMAETVRQREATLRDNEARFRSLVEGMGEGLMIVGRDRNVAEVNPAAEKILGRPRHELVGRPAFSWWTPIREDGTHFPEDDHPAHRSLEGGHEVSNLLMGLQHTDGRELWIQINSRPLYAFGDEAGEVLLTFSEVTGLKIAEEALRLSKLRFQELYQQFSALLEGITDRISLLAPDMQAVWSNRHPGGGCIDLVDQSSGTFCYQQSFGRAEPCADCPAIRCFATAEPAEGEVADAVGRTWALRSFPVIARGEVQNVVMIAEDVTEKREGDRQRSRANQLAALGELAAGVAHEINNPISGVINYAQLLLNRAEAGSREHDIAGRIIREGDRIASIVRELLTFAREESAEVRIISIREALADALSLCETALHKEGVSLHIELPSDLPRVASRGHQLQQLFLNLISNARHALAEKFPEAHPEKIIKIRGCPSEADGSPGIRLVIRDQGVGIPQDMLERVMIPFVTTKPAGVGTGLGLSVSFDIVKKHGGFLRLASEYGAWTEVTVDLPAYRLARGEETASS